MLRVMKDAGVLKGLTNALKLVDFGHPQVIAMTCFLWHHVCSVLKLHMLPCCFLAGQHGFVSCQCCSREQLPACLEQSFIDISVPYAVLLLCLPLAKL